MHAGLIQIGNGHKDGGTDQKRKQEATFVILLVMSLIMAAYGKSKFILGCCKIHINMGYIDHLL